MKEIHHNFFIGKYSHHIKMAYEEHCDVLVPLNDLDGDIWNQGWRGEILYIPIEDYKVLPKDVAIKYCNKIIDYLEDGKKVGMFCVGGHGRTGYMAAIILGLLSYPDPIAYIRANYCTEAIECQAQINAIAEALNKPQLLVHQPAFQSLIYDSRWNNWDNSLARYITANKNLPKTCHDCIYLYDPPGECLISGDPAHSNDEKCKDFYSV
jgi:hypothetical protein